LRADGAGNTVQANPQQRKAMKLSPGKSPFGTESSELIVVANKELNIIREE
jgi:hypothetical protein